MFPTKSWEVQHGRDAKGRDPSGLNWKATVKTVRNPRRGVNKPKLAELKIFANPCLGLSFSRIRRGFPVLDGSIQPIDRKEPREAAPTARPDDPRAGAVETHAVGGLTQVEDHDLSKF